MATNRYLLAFNTSSVSARLCWFGFWYWLLGVPAILLVWLYVPGGLYAF